MAKETGLAWTTLDVDDQAGSAQDLRDPVTNLSFATPREVQDVTGIDKSAMERLLLLADFSATLNGAFDDAANSAHAVLSTAPSDTDPRTMTIVVSGQTLTNEVRITDYALTRDANGALTWTAPAVLADGTVPTWA